jgi:hypothetical protein
MITEISNVILGGEKRKQTSMHYAGLHFTNTVLGHKNISACHRKVLTERSAFVSLNVSVCADK